MTTYSLDIIIKAIDQASANLKAVGSSMGALGQEANSAAQSLQPLGAGLAALSATGGALIGVAAMTAARVEVLGTVLNTVGEHAGYTTEELAAFETGLMESGITAGASRQALIQMAQAEIDLSHATDLARLAQNAAVIANINSSEAYERLITGIQRGQPILLRTMGITVDFQGAYKKMAAQLGKTTAELSTSEKMQARVNEVMSRGEAIAGVYEDAMGDVGKKLGSVKGDIQDAANALGKSYLPAMESAVDATRDALAWFTELDAGTQKNIATFLALGTAVTGFAGSAILLTPKIIAMGGSLVTLTGFASNTAFAMQLLAAGSNTAGLGLAGLAASAITVLGPLAAMYGALIAVDRLYQPHVENIIATTESYHAYAMNMAYVGREADVLTEAEWRLARSTEDTGVAVSNLSDGWTGQYSPALISAREQTDGWATSLELASMPLGALGERVVAVSDNVGTYLGKLGMLQEALEGPVSKANEDYEEQQVRISHELIEARKRLKELTAQHGVAYGSTEDLTIAQYAGQQATEKLAAAHQALAENTDPERQLQLQAAVAKATQAVGRSDRTVRNASGGMTDYSGDIADTEASIADLTNELGILDVQHRAVMNQIVYDMMMARLATEGWTSAETELALETARAMGIIDEETWAAATNMNAALDSFAEGESVDNTIDSILGIGEEISGLGPIADEIGTGIGGSLEAGGAAGVAAFDKVSAAIAGVPTSIDVVTKYSHTGTPPWEQSAGGARGEATGEEGYQHGTDYVPRTGWAYLHRGEAVLPEPVAAQHRAGDMNINLTANYAHQPEHRVRDDLRMAQLLWT